MGEEAGRVVISPHMSKSLKILALALVLGVAVGAEPPGGAQGAGHQPTRSAGIRIVTVVKVRGLAWFDRMAHGIGQFADRTGVEATMTAAHNASHAVRWRSFGA